MSSYIVKTATILPHYDKFIILIYELQFLPKGIFISVEIIHWITRGDKMLTGDLFM